MMSLRRSYEPKKPKDWLRLSQFLRVPVVRRKHQGRERIASWFFSWRPIEWNESIHLFFFFCFLIASYSTPTVQVRQFKVELTCFFCALLDALLGSVCVCLRCGCTQATRQSQGCKTNPMKKERKKRPATREAWLTRRACATIEARAHNWIGELRKKKERPSSTPISTWNSFFFFSLLLLTTTKNISRPLLLRMTSRHHFSIAPDSFFFLDQKREMEDDDKYV